MSAHCLDLWPAAIRCIYFLAFYNEVLGHPGETCKGSGLKFVLLLVTEHSTPSYPRRLSLERQKENFGVLCSIPTCEDKTQGHGLFTPLCLSFLVLP